MAIIFPSPLVVAGVAVGMGYLVLDSLADVARKVRNSYRDPSTLLDGTTNDDKMTLVTFFAKHDPNAPCVLDVKPKGDKKEQPPETKPSATTQAQQPDPKALGEEIPQPQVLERLEIPAHRRQILLSAAQREGKSNLIRVLMSEQLKQDSTVKIHYMSSKVTDTIPPEWNGHLIAGNRDELMQRLEELIDEWQDIFQRHAKDASLPLEWLIFDEFFYFQSLAKPNKALRDKLNHLVISLATQGSSCNLGSVLIGQTENAGELGLSEDLLRKNYITIAPARSKHREALRSIEKLVRGKTQYHPQTKVWATEIAKSRPFAAFLAMDSEELSIYFPPEYQGELVQLTPVMVGGNALLESVRAKVGHRPLSAGDIRKSFVSDDRPELSAIQAILDRLVIEGELQVVGGGRVPKYQIKFVPPMVPPQLPPPSPADSPPQRPSLRVVPPGPLPFESFIEDEAGKQDRETAAIEAEYQENTQKRLAAADLVAQLQVAQMGPNNAVEFFNKTGNEYILYAFQEQYVGAHLMTDAEYQARVKIAMQQIA